MLQRLLSMLGFGYYLPTSSELGINGSNAPETDGQAEVAFLPGKKTAIEAETDQNQDERRQNLTDDSLVWPGKTDTLTYPNDEPVDYRVSLTVTDLEPSYYMRRPAIGGQWQPDQSVLLRPGEETKFEVAFTPPMNADKAVPRNFNYVLTRFDPRRANDAGEIVGEVPLRWVPLPKSNDLKIGANPPVVIMRPWRRAALFNLEFLNRSQLPPSVSLRVQRAESKTKLEEEPEQVATVSQSLPSRTPGVWRLLLPASAVRGSYFATVVGEAKVADGATYPLRLEKPVLVRYVPWLRVAKDWVFLLSGLFLLLLIVWGIPVLKAPVVTFNPEIQLEKGGDKSKIEFYAVSDQDPENRKKAYKREIDGYIVTLPARWYGWRPFFGWNTNELYKFHVSVAHPDGNPAYENLPDTLETTDGKTIQETSLKNVSFFGGWSVPLAVKPFSPPPPPPNDPRPMIDRCEPSVVQPGPNQIIVIVGKHFGKSGAAQFSPKPEVYNNGKILDWRDTRIKVEIPDALTVSEGEITVYVQPDGAEKSSLGATITVTLVEIKPAVITACNPASLQAGSGRAVVIMGRDFGKSGVAQGSQGGKATPVQVLDWKDAQIKVQIPDALTAKAGEFTLAVKPDRAEKFSNEYPVKVTEIPRNVDFLQAFRDFFVADYHNAALTDDAKAKAKIALDAAPDYEKHGRDRAVSAALQAVLHTRQGEADGVDSELAAAQSNPLASAFAQAYLQTQSRGWAKTVNEADFKQLESLANGGGPSILKDCSHKLVADWYGNKRGADTEKEAENEKKIHDPQIRNLQR